MNHEVEPAVGEVAADLSYVNLTEVSSTVEELAFTVALNHGLIGLATVDDGRFLVSRVDAQANRNWVAVKDLLAVSIDKVDA
jgi:hypothetical protein